jgi:hypothetical protein
VFEEIVESTKIAYKPYTQYQNTPWKEKIKFTYGEVWKETTERIYESKQ